MLLSEAQGQAELRESQVAKEKGEYESRVEQLEKKLENVNKMTVDSDKVKKMKYDNHIL